MGEPRPTRYRVCWPVLGAAVRLLGAMKDGWIAQLDDAEALQTAVMTSMLTFAVSLPVAVIVGAVIDGKNLPFIRHGHIYPAAYVFGAGLVPLALTVAWGASYVLAGLLWGIAWTVRQVPQWAKACIPRIERESLVDRERIKELERDLSL